MAEGDVRLLVGTSWKMNHTASDAIRYCETLLPLVADIVDRELFILPPFTAIWALRERLAGSRVAWGAQTVHPARSGAHTGDISAAMLADLGCTYVAIGHAERRRDWRETDDWAAAQVASVQEWGMTAILCVGEVQRLAFDDAMDCVHAQLRALDGARAAGVVVAYEPAWAIGTGAASADPDWIERVHTGIHEWLAANLRGGAAVPVIYGGSVDSRTAAGILERPAVNGLFVGRSALDPVEFARIAHVDMPRRRGWVAARG